MARDYGSGLSRYLDPTGRNYDTVVMQEGKPALDSEVVFLQELQNEGEWTRRRTSVPSGFLTGDFLDKEITDYDFRGEANRFYLVNRPVVQVNGWVFPVEYSSTSTAGENQIDLDAPPAGLATVGADFVFLEVWRALLTPNPSTTNKPSATEIYHHGNVLSLAPEWITEEMIDTDPNINIETTLRVQVQYRIRTVRLNTRDTRLGYDDANVFAQGPNGAPTAFTYSPDADDKGLWVAGAGNPATTGTVDGYIYSIPLCIVYRRNSDAWDYLSNGNGGALIASGTSDRPDGLYSDEIVLPDLLDLRAAVSFTGFDLTQLHDHTLSLLQDQELRSMVTDNAHTGWYVAGNNVGNRYLKGDDIIPSTPVTDPPSGNTIRSADGICKVFSDRPHIQRHTVVYAPPGGTWTVGDQVSLDFTAISGIGAPIADEQPTGTVVLDVVEARLDDTDTVTGYLPMPVQKVEGLGTQTATLTMGAPPVPGSTQNVWVTYDVEYPSGGGLTSHVTEEVTGFSFLVHNPSAYNGDIGVIFTDDTAGRAAIRPYLTTSFEAAHRELTVTYTTDAAVSLSVYAASATTIYLPEEIGSVVSVTDSGATTHTVDSFSDRMIQLDVGDPLPTADDLVTVQYYPKRALPINGASHTTYYRTAALQAIAAEYLPATLSVTPVYTPETMHVITASSGSVLDQYPFEAGSQQIPVHGSATYTGEDELNAPGDTSIDDFAADTGALQLPVMVPMVTSEPLSFTDLLNVGLENEEYIDHYRTAPTAAYKPGIFTQNLSANVAHKTYYSMLARLENDEDFARAGSLVLLVLSHYHDQGRQNRVAMSDAVLDAGACVAVYRLKGNPLI